MRRALVAVLLVLGMSLGVLAAPALAQGPPRHPHMLVIGLELDENGNPVGFRRCVDLAGGRALPLRAHHAHVHTGRAGEALRNAGHAVVPGAPLTPWRNCADLIAEFFPGS